MRHRRGRALIGLKHPAAAAAALEQGLQLAPDDAALLDAAVLAKELMAQREAAVPVALAASKWPGAPGQEAGSEQADVQPSQNGAAAAPVGTESEGPCSEWG